MSDDNASAVTRILADLGDADEDATERLLPFVYEELRALARRQMAREPANHTLQPTALVHEAFLRLVRGDANRWQNRAHFFAAAAEAMRRILVERARRVGRLKRGGDRGRIPLDDAQPAIDPGTQSLLDLDAALTEFQERYGRQARVVQLRFFAGLSVAETADVLRVSQGSVKNDWRFAKAWLRGRMDRDAAG